MQVRSLGRKDPPEKGTAIHSSILFWRIPWTEEAGRLQSIGSQRAKLKWLNMHTRFCLCFLPHTHFLSHAFHALSCHEHLEPGLGTWTRVGVDSVPNKGAIQGQACHLWSCLFSFLIQTSSPPVWHCFFSFLTSLPFSTLHSLLFCPLQGTMDVMDQYSEHLLWAWHARITLIWHNLLLYSSPSYLDGRLSKTDLFHCSGLHFRLCVLISSTHSQQG